MILLTSKLLLFLIYFPCDLRAFRRLHSRATPCFSVCLLKSEITFICLGKDVKSENITSLISSVSINQPTNQLTNSLTNSPAIPSTQPPTNLSVCLSSVGPSVRPSIHPSSTYLLPTYLLPTYLFVLLATYITPRKMVLV